MVDLSDHKAPGKWKMHPTKSDRGNANTAIGHYVSSDLASCIDKGGANKHSEASRRHR